MEVHYLAVYDGHAGTGAALMAAKALVNHLQVHGGHTLHSLSLTVPNLSLFFTPQECIFRQNNINFDSSSDLIIFGG